MVLLRPGSFRCTYTGEKREKERGGRHVRRLERSGLSIQESAGTYIRMHA